MLISGTSINSARNGLKPAFLKMNQYGISITIEIMNPKRPKNMKRRSECVGPNP
jgi:hypothetical protein